MTLTQEQFKTTSDIFDKTIEDSLGFPSDISDAGLFRVELREGAIVGMHEGIQWMEPVLTDIGFLSELTPNWDGCGAEPISDQLLVYSFQLLDLLLRENDSPPKLSPDPEGGIQMEWQTERETLQIHIDANGELRASFDDEEKELEWDLIPYDESDQIYSQIELFNRAA